LESELVNDAVYGTLTGTEVTLSEFLGNHFGTGLRIQEAVPDDLTDEFLSAPIVGFGSPFAAEKGFTALFEKKSSQLEVTLTAKAEFGSDAVNALCAAFAVDKHSKFTSDFVVFGNGEGAEFTFDALLEKLNRNHGGSSWQSATISLFNYGTIFQGMQEYD
jgi:hypothetical protein